jgi:hypothetical protein
MMSPVATPKPHRLQSLGHMKTSFASLGTAAEAQLRKGGEPLARDDFQVEPGGIIFGVMEDESKTFRIVKIGGRVLSAHFELVEGRHGSVPGPKATHLDDDAAVRILTDAIIHDSEHADEFAAVIRRIGTHAEPS